MKFIKRHSLLPALLIGLPFLAATTTQACPGGTCAMTNPGAETTQTGCCSPAACSIGDTLSALEHPTFEAETNSLLQEQITEERMAARVYRTLAKVYPQVRPFQMIPLAEDRHGDAVVNLLKSADPAFSESTMKIDPSYPTLGDELITRGSSSETEALRVGAYIEEKDILDLRSLAARLDDDGAKAIVAPLEQGSYHHLSAFVRNLRRHGENYTPQLLTADAFDEIISAES